MMLIVVVYIPDTDVDQVIEAMAEAGAGQIGHYRACAFKLVGEGQFQPMSGANPTIGRIGELEKVAESRIEMVCQPEQVKLVLSAMLTAHPYEVPAYHVLEGKTVDDF